MIKEKLIEIIKTEFKKFNNKIDEILKTNK